MHFHNRRKIMAINFTISGIPGAFYGRIGQIVKQVKKNRFFDFARNREQIKNMLQYQVKKDILENY